MPLYLQITRAWFCVGYLKNWIWNVKLGEMQLWITWVLSAENLLFSWFDTLLWARACLNTCVDWNHTWHANCDLYEVLELCFGCCMLIWNDWGRDSNGWCVILFLVCPCWTLRSWLPKNLFGTSHNWSEMALELGIESQIDYDWIFEDLELKIHQISLLKLWLNP